MDIGNKQLPTGASECQHCGKELFGRADKRFCNDTCRNRYHARALKRRQWEEPSFVAQITRQLLRNRKLLQKAIPFAEETTVTTKTALEEKGFDFRFYTNILETQKGRYYYCYEYGWLQLSPNKLLIVRTNSYDNIAFSD